MLEQILKLYVMAMATGVTSPLPHLFGPPGAGKSSVVRDAAELLGVNCHVINVARISPLDLEGVQMPNTLGEEMFLQLLHATQWTQLKEGDILLLDEFLRGFPEVYNGLLDIITSREVAGLRLPKVFIIAASNTTVAYDKALEDRLLHLPVPDPRKKKSVKNEMAQRMVDELGLLPSTATCYEMSDLLDAEVLPMFEVLDQLGKPGQASASIKGSSLRKLIGQTQLRQIESGYLHALLNSNNRQACNAGKHQYVLLPSAKDAPPSYEAAARRLVGNPRLTAIQELNLQLNLQLLDLEAARKQKGIPEDDDNFVNEQSPF